MTGWGRWQAQRFSLVIPVIVCYVHLVRFLELKTYRKGGEMTNSFVLFFTGDPHHMASHIVPPPQHGLL